MSDVQRRIWFEELDCMDRARALAPKRRAGETWSTPAPAVARATALRSERDKHLRKAKKLWKKIAKAEKLGMIHRVVPR